MRGRRIGLACLALAACLPAAASGGDKNAPVRVLVRIAIQPSLV